MREQPVVHADETGWYEHSKRAWLWVAVTGHLALFLIRARRSARVAKELLGAAFAGILVSDRWARAGTPSASRAARMLPPRAFSRSASFVGVAPEGWTLVRWPEEVAALLAAGEVEAVSLDHDLGDDARTGYDALTWIE